MPVSLFWATYEQQGNTIALWIDTDTDRTINLLFGRFEIPTTWFQSFNPAMIFAFTPFVVAFWARQAQRGTEPSTTLKMSFGCALCGLSYLILMAAALHAGDNKASWLWLFVYFVVITTGELYLSPIGLSLVSKIAPRGHLAMMMGMWLGTSFVGNFLAGYLGSFWSSMTKPMFFLMLAAISLGAAAAIFALAGPCAARSCGTAEPTRLGRTEKALVHMSGSDRYGAIDPAAVLVQTEVRLRCRDEGTHIGRAAPARLEHEAHRHRRRVKLCQNVTKPTGSHVGLDLIGERARNAEPVSSRIDCGLRSVGEQPRLAADRGAP